MVCTTRDVLVSRTSGRCFLLLRVNQKAAFLVEKFANQRSQVVIFRDLDQLRHGERILYWSQSSWLKDPSGSPTEKVFISEILADITDVIYDDIIIIFSQGS